MAVSKDISSPFTPGLPAPVEIFKGRQEEIQRLLDKVRACQSGKLQVAFLTGERGIGKTSLASFVRVLSEHKYGMISIHTFLGGVDSLEELVYRVFDRLLKESIEKPWYQKLSDFFGDHIKQVGLFEISVEFRADPDDLHALVRDFALSLRNLIRRVRDHKKGILIVLDDINGIARSMEFANWIKSLADEIATAQEPVPLCLVFVGLDERRQELIHNQPSLARILNPIDIRTLSDVETRALFTDAFSKVSMEVEEPALDLLVRFSGGLPVIAHELGDAAFNIDVDGKISLPDATRALIEAAGIIGRKHVEPQVFHVISSERYRKILRKLASDPFKIRFERAEVKAQLTPPEAKVFDNFLRRMVQLGVLARQETGVYRFTNTLHYLYFWMEAERAKKRTSE